MKPPACCIAYRDLATQDFTIGAWAILVDLEQVISERVSELLTVDTCRIPKCQVQFTLDNKSCNDLCAIVSGLLLIFVLITQGSVQMEETKNRPRKAIR